jgi:hypothetical protein
MKPLSWTWCVAWLVPLLQVFWKTTRMSRSMALIVSDQTDCVVVGGLLGNGLNLFEVG